MAERNTALRPTLAPRCQQVLAMLIGGRPCSLEEIDTTRQIPVGSIRPPRARCPKRLCNTNALAGLRGPDVRWVKDAKHA